MLAGNGPRSVRLAAGYDGWATTGPDGEFTTDAVVGASGPARRTSSRRPLDQAGRDPETMQTLSLDGRGTGLLVLRVSSFTESAGRAHDLGFTDVVIHWPRPSGTYAGDETVLDRIAAMLVDGEYRP